jgi:DNA-directed RNA polymerase subunit K/omega
MVSNDQLAKRSHTLYAVAIAASKRARTINDWRNERARVMMDELKGPKVTTQALQEIADGDVRVVLPEE